MKKQNFLTEEFYSDTCEALIVFNEIVSNKEMISEFDMYQSGEFLILTVHNTDSVRCALDRLISDYEAYREYNNSNFNTTDETVINLCGLQQLHREYYGHKDEIWYDEINDNFTTAEAMDYSDEL